MSKSAYLEPGRLADLIAAITALGAYRYYKLSFVKAAEKIGNEPERAKSWEQIFKDHPEFFRVVDDREKVSLVWRRQFKKNYDPKTGDELSRSTVDSLPSERRNALSRRPLNSDEMVALIDVALRSHARAVEAEQLKRWWIPVLAAILGFVGALAGAAIAS